MRRPLVPSFAAVLLVSCAILTAGAASAHAILLASTPASGTTVKAGPAAFELRYNSRLDRVRSGLRLVRPDRTETALPIAPEGPEDVLRSSADLAPGAYVLRWQVLAVDGHITRGDVRFTVGPKP